jgi:diaminohydroxyphosphoribosylaminopyrimidine deaminase/5-amino-6-(5-phosphoribosylamino)uracil reductase
VDSIIASGVVRVVVAAGDPDPRVSGLGLARLREAGIEVIEGMMAAESRALDPGYFHHRETGRPLVTVKYAMTLDGLVAAADATSRWITSETAREDAHRLRASMDAVMVGAGTVRADDPLLDVRLEGYEGRQPRPVILMGERPLPDTARVLGRDPVVVTAADSTVQGVEVIRVQGLDGRPDPLASASALADIGLLTILLEGGPTVAGAWWSSGLIDRGVVYIGAKVGGGAGRSPFDGVFGTMDDARVVTITGTDSLDGDLRVDFRTG